MKYTRVLNTMLVFIALLGQTLHAQTPYTVTVCQAVGNALMSTDRSNPSHLNARFIGANSSKNKSNV